MEEKKILQVKVAETFPGNVLCWPRLQPRAATCLICKHRNHKHKRSVSAVISAPSYTTGLALN